MLTSLLALMLTSQVPAPDATIAEQVARTESVGVIVFALDRAAWVASDALTTTLPKDQLAGVGGWVVEHGDADGSLIVTFYRGVGDEARAIFVADVRQEKVRSSRLAPPDTILTPNQQRLARARSAAMVEATARSYRPCTSAPFNTVVLPNTDATAPVWVYLLTAQTTAGTYPIGGHFRVVVGADGKVAASRPFSKSCINMSLPRSPDGHKAAGLFVSHILDPLPTEVHVFSSLSVGLPLFVGAGGKVWTVNGRTITASELEPPPLPR